MQLIFDRVVPEALAALLIPSIIAIVKGWIESKSRRRSTRRLDRAEEQAFPKTPEILVRQIEKLAADQSGLESKAEKLANVIEEQKSLMVQGSLFNLYNRQIEQYQDETRSRASWSFYIAMVAMFAGFGFVVWGGHFALVQKPENVKLAAGAFVATVGGTISAFLAKTFLDIHRLSLEQLNRYFEQPVINDHIIMAQRVADLVPVDERSKLYEKIVDRVLLLVQATGDVTRPKPAARAVSRPPTKPIVNKSLTAGRTRLQDS